MPGSGEDIQTHRAADHRFLSVMDRLKRILVLAITIMMGFVLLLAVVDLGFILVKDILSPPILILDVNELLQIFGLFLLVLIGIELFETMEIYIKENVVHVEVVFTVALIAIARKVIILDVKKMESATLLGIAAIILALSIGYYLIYKALPAKKREAGIGTDP
jgi:uncharacterized membrane protein (DUF373 family)